MTRAVRDDQGALIREDLRLQWQAVVAPGGVGAMAVEGAATWWAQVNLANTIDGAEAVMASYMAIQDLFAFNTAAPTPVNDFINQSLSVKVLKINFKQILNQERQNLAFFEWMAVQQGGMNNLKNCSNYTKNDLDMLRKILNGYNNVIESFTFENLLSNFQNELLPMLSNPELVAVNNKFKSIVSQVLLVPFCMTMKETILQIKDNEKKGNSSDWRSFINYCLTKVAPSWEAYEKELTKIDQTLQKNYQLYAQNPEMEEVRVMTALRQLANQAHQVIRQADEEMLKIIQDNLLCFQFL